MDLAISASRVALQAVQVQFMFKRTQQHKTKAQNNSTKLSASGVALHWQGQQRWVCHV
jgi:hypothetical protein